MASTNDTTKLTYPWVLWYHDPEKTDWSEKSYIQIADVNTVQQFWTVINNVPLDVSLLAIVILYKNRIYAVICFVIVHICD